jgi:diadenosine tetraphosphatase ApaH/serine/threonine PP2A family protein phosphatase
MRYAIISDIHSNLEALTIALSEIRKIGYDKIICLGDIIGYGPDPEACIDLVFENANHILLGNHEEALINLSHLKNFTRYAKEALTWTLDHVSSKYLKMLTGLKLTYEIEDVLFVHSTPDSPELWEYISSYRDAKGYLYRLSQTICFIGHSHIAGVYTKSNDEIISRNSPAIINVGSIGQPRDLNPMLSFGIFDSKKWVYNNHRFPYDLDKTQRKIIASGLPSYLAVRLGIGT